MLIKKDVIIFRIILIIILYILQGLIHGFKSSIPLYLSSYNASWEDQGIFSWVIYPFSFKILWAPIIDSIYLNRFGRNLTWLLPIQLIIGIILIILSFYFESFLINLKIKNLTIIFILIFILIASQDIVVDGWSIILFSSSNLQWSSTCQTIGQVIGHFCGSTLLITLESSNFTNKYIRKPFSFPEYSYGLISLKGFILFWGILFILISIIILIISLNKNKLNKNIQIKPKLNLSQTYLSIWKLLKKNSIQQLSFILLTFDIGFAATNSMTILTLSEYGIKRDTIALINIPFIFIHIIVSLYMSNIKNPLIWFNKSYIPRLFISIILSIYILLIPKLIDKYYFYPILIILLCLNEILLFIMIVSRVGFYAKISESNISGTYMTLLSAISNLGHSILTTLILYLANFLPKSYEYIILVTICFIFGFIWIKLFSNRIKYLDKLPIDQWYLKSSSHSNIINDEQIIYKDN